MKGVKILGDKVNPYLIFTNGHDGINAVRAALTPVRVVCNNTLNFALKDAPRVWSTKHLGDVQSKLRAAEITLQIATNYLKDVKEYSEVMAEKQMTRDALEDFINDMFPIDDNDTDRVKKSIVLLQDELRERIAAPDLKKFNGTAWQALNAVVDMANHSRPRRQTNTFAEKRFIKSIDGDNLIEKAQKILLAA